MSLLDREREAAEPTETHDREISLGTATLLGIFFGLALLCAGCFGFGYQLGRKSAQGSVAAPQTAGGVGLVSVGKPSPGHSSLDPAPGPAASAAQTTGSIVVPTAPSDAPPRAVESVEAPAPAEPPASNKLETAAAPSALVTPAPVAGPGVSFMVQVAAVTHQEDADMLVSALKAKGYNVAVHTLPADKFMHVQLGPFNNRKDAEAMRQRLLTDGFNAILK